MRIRKGSNAVIGVVPLIFYAPASGYDAIAGRASAGNSFMVQALLFLIEITAEDFFQGGKAVLFDDIVRGAQLFGFPDVARV